MLSYVLYGLSGALIAFGIYMLMLYVSAMPTQKSESVVAEVNKLDNVQSQTLINKLLGGISKLFLPLVELSDSTKYQIQAALSYFNYNVTPEQHFCDALTSGIVCVCPLWPSSHGLGSSAWFSGLSFSKMSLTDLLRE